MISREGGVSPRTPTLVVLGGLPGVGKTTLARELARRLHAVHVRIDSIEHAIGQSSLSAGRQLEDAGYLVGYAVAEDNLRLGRVVIADSVNPWPQTRDAWLAVARRAAVPAFEVEVICSDPDEHRRRVEHRVPDIDGFTTPTWQEVVDRDYRTWSGVRLVVDTSRASAEQAADRIVAALAGPDSGEL